MTLRLPRADLEEWMREFYFAAEIDIGSSGVQDFAFGELRPLLGIAVEELDELLLCDSQTLGGPSLREAVARRWSAGRVDRVMATHGSTEANFLVMNGLLDPGDEVVVLDPCYQQLYSIAESIGCRLKRWPLERERGFQPELEALARLVDERTKMVIVNFPHNPTGASITREEQLELIRRSRDVGAYLVWDGAFSELTYSAPPLPDPGLDYERAISTGTLSKAYGLPGLRVGWCIAAPEVLAKLVRLRDYLTLHLSPLVELVAAKAVDAADLLVEPRLDQARRNLQVLAAWIDEHGHLVDWVRPRGGVCAFPRFRGVGDTNSFCRRLAELHKVLLVPGECFRRPGHVRLGFGRAEGELREGLTRLSDFLIAAEEPAAQEAT